MLSSPACGPKRALAMHMPCAALCAVCAELFPPCREAAPTGATCGVAQREKPTTAGTFLSLSLFSITQAEGGAPALRSPSGSILPQNIGGNPAGKPARTGVPTAGRTTPTIRHDSTRSPLISSDQRPKTTRRPIACQKCRPRTSRSLPSPRACRSPLVRNAANFSHRKTLPACGAREFAACD